MIAGEVVAQRFEIESRAGAGGMGTVYRARDRVSGAPVAVKLITEASEASSSRFAHEARVLCELDHPAVVRYVLHGVDVGRAYLVMEWLEGEDLATRLARGPLGVDEALQVARRIGAALAAAHARGVVHRDIKPGNLFLPSGDVSRVKLLDFGIARSRGAGGFDTTVLPITRTGAVLGTVGYMSPEQARGAADVDERTDVFALGCVLYECVAGRPAFAGANAVAVLAKVLLEDAPRLRDAPPAFAELVARMLSRDPTKRPRDGAQLLRALEATSSVDGATSSSGGLGDREQRVMSIVLARGIAATVARGVAALRDLELIELADGALLVAERGNDATTHAAAVALALRRAASSGAIAVATGRVTNAEDGWVGPIIDRAATILAPAPDIAIDDLSAALLRDRFAIAGNQGAFRLLGTARASEPRTLLGRRTPFVGRDKELALLEATFEECAGEPIARAVLVTAPAGSGKSRLQHELLGRVRGRATVLFSRGDPIGAGSSLGVLRQLVRSAANVREGDAASLQHAALRAHLATFFSGEALDRTAEMLGEMIGAPPPAASAALRAAREDLRVLAAWVRRAFGEWLAAMCDDTPLLLVIEDLHWGDPASVTYLEEAVRENATRPLMVLALARPEVRDLFPELWKRIEVQELRLPALTRRAAERLVRSVLDGADDEVVAHVVARAEGNAFSLEELIRHVAERSDAALPDSVLAVAEARIARLDPERRRLLRVASIFGEAFWTGGLAALLEHEDGSAIDGELRALCAEEILVARPESRFTSDEYAFRHGLLRDVAYAMLTEDDRRAGHGRAGDWLERSGERDPLVLADHFERAAEHRRAAPWLLRAGERAFDGHDFAAAERIAERGARIAEGPLLGRFRAVQAMVASARGDYASSVAHAKEAYALIPRGTSESYLAAANVLQAGAYVGDLELAPQIVQDMLTTTPKDRPGGAYGLAVRMMTDILDNIGQRETCDAFVARAERLAAETPDCDPIYLGWLAFDAAARAVRRDEDLGLGLERERVGRAHFEAVGAPLGLAMCDYGLGFTLTEIGASEQGRAKLRDAAAVFNRVGAPLFAAWCGLNISGSYLNDRRSDDAIAAARPALYTPDHRHARANIAMALLDQGRTEEAAEQLRDALEGLDDRLVTPWVVALVHVADALIERARGAHTLALAAVERARVAAVLQPGSVRTWIDLVEVQCLRELDRDDDARAVLRPALARLDRHASSLSAEHAQCYRALRPNAELLRLARELL